MEVVQLLNPVRVLVLTTFFIVIFRYRKKTHEARFLRTILAASALHEVVAAAMIYHGISSRVLTNVYVFVHAVLWIRLLPRPKKFPAIMQGAAIGYILFATMNFFIGEGIDRFAFLNFIVGSIVYVTLFLLLSFRALDEERFSFFFSPLFLLLLAPVAFFIGMSLMFGFRSRELDSVELFAGYSLYEAVSTFGNFLYYGLILLFVYRERKR